MDIDVVLGIDFMLEQDVSVSVAHRKMMIGKQEFPLQCSGQTGCYSVVLTDRIEIPAGTEIITQGKVNEASISHIGIGLEKPSETAISDGKMQGIGKSRQDNTSSDSELFRGYQNSVPWYRHC